MKMFYLLSIFYLASCVRAGYESKDFFNSFFTECEAIIGKKASNQTVYEKKLGQDYQDSPEIIVTYVQKNGIVEMCNITFTFSDFVEVKQYYNKLHDFVKNDWDFVKPVSKYKQPNGEIYSKNGIYLEIYEPVYFVIPLSFSKDIDHYNFSQAFNQPEMVYGIEYYKTEIIKYRNFFDERQEIVAIEKIDNIIPDLLCFLVCWDDNLKGYIYELYTFTKNQEIINKYMVGFGPLIRSYRNILMGNLPGNKIEHELISFGDFNNDGNNEILSYSFYVNKGYVFVVFGYDIVEKDFVHTCLTPVFINFENPFPSVEYNGTGFKILEIVDEEPMELQWNNYKWDKNIMKYIKE
jgi:hypothetical protein